jgi:hypothetical protein
VARQGKPRGAGPRARSRLPLDDPRWRPITTEHKLLAERDGDPHLAALELNQALTGNKVRCMGRFIASGKRELVPSTFWADYELSYWSDGLKVTPRRRRGEKGSRIVIPLRGVVLYVWEPDADKLRRQAEQETQPETDAPPRHKPDPPPPPARKSNRGAKVKLQDNEIAAGMGIVRREDAKHQKRYPKRKLKQADAIKALRQELKRDGKPIKVSPTTLLRWIVRPARGPK